MHLAKQLSILTLSAALFGCGESNSSSAGPDFGGGQQVVEPNTFNEAQLISNLTDNVIAPVFTEATTAAQALQSDLSTYCSAQTDLVNGGDSTVRDQALQQAQAQWLVTMAWWQQAEMMQVGPLVSDNSALRNKIYSWPVVNRCAVDQEVLFFEAGEINGAPYDITLRTDTRKGLDALEYLLFAPSLDHQCPATVAPENWNSRGEDERQLARCLYAAAAAEELSKNLELLEQRWQAHAADMQMAGEAGSSFATQQEAVNRLSDALFYLDSLTKDAKLNAPIQQYTSGCDAECANALESGLSGSSLTNISNNLNAFKVLFVGADGIGFDDYLADVGSNELAQQMLADIDTAIAQQAQLGASLVEQLNQAPTQVQQLHDDTKAVTDQLKVDFITDLALDLPATSAGDND